MARATGGWKGAPQSRFFLRLAAIPDRGWTAAERSGQAGGHSGSRMRAGRDFSIFPELISRALGHAAAEAPPRMAVVVAGRCRCRGFFAIAGRVWRGRAVPNPSATPDDPRGWGAFGRSPWGPWYDIPVDRGGDSTDRHYAQDSRERHRAEEASWRAGSAMISLPAAAQAPWPTRPFRLVVPFAPGGSTT
jgi:hypothetical protein